MHYDDNDMQARWAQTQADGEAVIAYLTAHASGFAHVTVTGGIDGDEYGITVPGTATVEHGFPQVTVMFDDGSQFAFHAARLAPYNRYTDEADDDCCPGCKYDRCFFSEQ